jgi:cold shock protein
MPDDLDIRRPDLLHVRRFGTVRWWKDDKGYGRITADDGEVLWAHFSALSMDGTRNLREGQRVSFVWNGGIQDHGRHAAEEVRLADGRGAEQLLL